MSLKSKLAQLSPEQKQTLLAKLKQKQPGIETVTAFTRVPLTPSQNRLWFLEQLNGPSDQYHIPFIIEIHGLLNIAFLEQAISELIASHRVLKTKIEDNNGEPQQYIDGDALLSLESIGTSSSSNVLDYVRAPFTLEEGLLVRFGLAQHDETHFTIAIVIHHIIFDAWSTELLFDQLISNYQSLLYQTNTASVPVKYDFIDYAHYLSKNKKAIDKSFWQQKLGAAPIAHSLPLDFERSSNSDNMAENLVSRLTPAVSDKLSRFAQNSQCANNIVYTALFMAFIARWGQGSDVVIGAPYAHRERNEFDQALGFFINNLVFRADFSQSTNLIDLLAVIKTQQVENLAQAHTPFDAVVELINPARSTLHAPIFQICINYQKSDQKDHQTNHQKSAEPQLNFAGLSFSAVEPPASKAKFDLILTVVEKEQGVAFEFKYNASLFKKQTIAHIANAFCLFVQEAIAEPQKSFDLLDISPSDQQTVNSVDLSLFSDENLIAAFNKQVASTPDAVAFCDLTQTISYHELNENALALAGVLKKQHVKEGDVVGIKLASGLHFIKAVLAVLYNNATYLALDIKAPDSRNNFIIESSNVGLVIDEYFIEKHPTSGAAEVLFDLDSLLCDGRAKAPAYICYTSGTTGKPKGTVISHQSVLSLCNSQFVEITADSKILMCSNTAFDAMTFELWGSLLNGAAVCHYPHRFVEPEQLYQVLQQLSVNTAFITTALFREYVSWLKVEQKQCSLSQIMVGGEKASTKDFADYYALAPDVSLFNIYGPTENTTFSTIFRVPEAINPLVSVPIGKPMNDAFAYVVNSQGMIQPQGMVGELYLGGRGLADCYLENCGLTEQKFLSLTFLSQNNASQRMYRTGDLVYQNSDGDLVFIGRNDEQVKIRGFRVELEEITEVAREFAQVNHAYTRAVEVNQDLHLVCYYTGNNVDLTELTSFMQQRLPEYMVPSQWVHLASMPLNLNGKTDIKQLPEPSFEFIDDSDVSFNNDDERKLASIWQQLLPGYTISAQSHFFKNGGHSLLALKLLARIKQEFGRSIRIADIFTTPVLADLARRIAEFNNDRSELIHIAEDGQQYPLSSAQMRLWLVTQLQKTQTEFHMPNILRLDHVTSLDALKKAIKVLVQRHTALRTRFIQNDGEIFQQIESAGNRSLELVDAQHYSEQEISAKLKQLCQTPFDLLKGDVFHATWLQESETSGYLVIVIHHIVCDGVSIEVLGQELIQAYNNPEQLLAKPVFQYVDFVSWQQQWLTKSHVAKSLDWWQQSLQDIPAEHKLPLDFVRPQDIDTSGDSIATFLEKQVIDDLRHVAQKCGTTMFVVFQAVLSSMLSQYTRQQDIMMGAPVANRDEDGLGQAIGLFLNNVVLRNHVDDKMLVADFIAQVTHNTTQVFKHQHVPFEQVVEAVNPSRQLGLHPLFQIMINHQKRGEGDNFHSDDGVKLTVVGQDADAAKYDLTVYLVETPDQLKITFNYQTSLFKRDRIEHMLESFVTMLVQVKANIGSSVRELKQLSIAQPSILKGVSRVLPDKDLLTIIRDNCCEKFADKIMLSDSKSELTGSELWRRVISASHDLVHYHGVRQRDVIAIAGEKDVDYVVNLLAVNLCGGIVAPLGIEVPEERLRAILTSSNIKLIISSAQIKQTVIDQVYCLNYSHTPDECNLRETDSPLYLIFTSGSTGIPKGVLGTEQGMLNRCHWMQQEFNVSDSAPAVHITEMGYIRAMWELYLPLIKGQMIQLLPGNYFNDLNLFSSLLQQQKVEQIVTAPSILKAVIAGDDKHLIAQFSALKYWFVSGEAFPSGLSDRLLQHLPDVSFVNLYGSTEVTSDITFCRIGDTQVIVNAGTPVDNTQIAIVDQSNQALANYMVGEIAVGGAGIAQGYMNDADKISASFINMPVLPETKVYKTGDLGYINDSQQLVLLGREDEQLSVRGYRVELGEIEGAILQLDFVKESALLPVKHEQDGYRIIAFITSDEAWATDIQSKYYYQSLADARSFLAKRLPHYMLPSQFIVIDTIPLKSNGKLDRKALNRILSNTNAVNESVLPESDIERRLSIIWQQVLSRSTITLDDIFFDINGNSLLATQVINRIDLEFGISMPLKQIFTHPTLRWLSQAIEDALFIIDLDANENAEETTEYEEFEL